MPVRAIRRCALRLDRPTRRTPHEPNRLSPFDDGRCENDESIIAIDALIVAQRHCVPGCPSRIRCRKPAPQPATPARKSSNGVLSLRFHRMSGALTGMGEIRVKVRLTNSVDAALAHRG